MNKKMSKALIHRYAKFSGMVGVSFEWLALATFFILQPSSFDGRHPISFFATLPQTRIYFEIFYTVAAINFWVFFRLHLGGHYRRPMKVLAVSLVTFAATALWPYYPANSISTFVHISLFLTSSVTFMYVMYVVSKSDIDGIFRAISTGLVALSVVVFLAYVVLTQDGRSSLTMPLEAGWWLILQIWVIWISCHSYRDKKPVENRSIG